MIALPGYIDKELWQAFEENRAALKKPIKTDMARKLIVYELDRLKRAGHDANEALKQSIIHGWADVYEPKEKEISHKAASDADRTAAYLAEQREHAAAARVRRVV